MLFIVPGPTKSVRLGALWSYGQHILVTNLFSCKETFVTNLFTDYAILAQTITDTQQQQRNN